MRQRPTFGMDPIIQRSKEVIENFGLVLDVDGKRGKQPTADVVSNALAFLEQLPEKYRNKLVPEESVSVGYNGTVIFDFYSHKYFVSVEIGRVEMGFFCDIPSGRNPTAWDRKIDGRDLEILEALMEIYLC